MSADTSRRRFLKGATAAGSLLAAKTVLLESETAFAAPGPTAAGDRVRFGMIGIGMQGSNLLRDSISLPGVECVGAADLWDGRHTLCLLYTSPVGLLRNERSLPFPHLWNPLHRSRAPSRPSAATGGSKRAVGKP